MLVWLLSNVKYAALRDFSIGRCRMVFTIALTCGILVPWVLLADHFTTTNKQELDEFNWNQHFSINFHYIAIMEFALLCLVNDQT